MKNFFGMDGMSNMRVNGVGGYMSIVFLCIWDGVGDFNVRSRGAMNRGGDLRSCRGVKPIPRRLIDVPGQETIENRSRMVVRLRYRAIRFASFFSVDVVRRRKVRLK